MAVSHDPTTVSGDLLRSADPYGTFGSVSLPLRARSYSDMVDLAERLRCETDKILISAAFVALAHYSGSAELCVALTREPIGTILPLSIMLNEQDSLHSIEFPSSSYVQLIGCLTDGEKFFPAGWSGVPG
jgi:hypothetical protein